MTNPGAVVSGPGALSQRTDSGGQPIRALPDPKYGEATAFIEQQKAAPLAEKAAMPPGPAPSEMVQATGPGPVAPERAPMPGLFDLGDPDIPVTSGAAVGPGPTEVTGGQMRPPPMSISRQLAEYTAGEGGDAVAWLANFLAERGQ